MPADPAVNHGDAALTAAELLNAVAVKLPLLWPDNIETWFIQTESQFRLKGVYSSQTKFDYCVESMSQEVTIKICSPPAKDPYRHLKD